MRLKHGVELRGISPEMSAGLIVIGAVLRGLGVDCVVTSVCDSKHGRNSLHYQGNAVDLRTRHVGGPMARKMANELGHALGPEFDVILESDHIHVEWQPEGPSTSARRDGRNQA